jgi:hypothetical protein
MVSRLPLPPSQSPASLGNDGVVRWTVTRLSGVRDVSRVIRGLM